MKFSKEPQKNNLDEGKTYNGTIFDTEEVKTMNNTTIMPELLSAKQVAKVSLSKNLCKPPK